MYLYKQVYEVQTKKIVKNDDDMTMSSCSSVVNLEMRSGGLWVLANVNVTGYFRVNYDLGNWERLLSQLHSQHKVKSLVFIVYVLIKHSVFCLFKRYNYVINDAVS